MEIKKITPNITTYLLNPNQEEDIYMMCMWGRITLDHDNYTLSAVTDCGNYNYQWSISDNEIFLSLMCRVDREYLLNKISSRKKFNLEESKKSTIENMEYYEDEEEYKEAIEFISDLEDVGEEGFYTEISDMFSWIDFETIELVKDYPIGAVVFCNIFIDYLQPVLKNELEIGV